MDIATFIFWCSAIYLIWFYSKRWKVKRQLKVEQKRLEAIELQKQKEAEEKERAEKMEHNRKRNLLGVPADSPHDYPIDLAKICTWEEESNGKRLLRYTPPFDGFADLKSYHTQTNGVIKFVIVIYVCGYGKCTICPEGGVLEKLNFSPIVQSGDKIARFIPQAEVDRQKKEEQERKQKQLEESKRKAEEAEKAAIAAKLKEKQRKRDLEKLVAQELIDSGELFGEQAKRPPIPREVVDAIYRRDGGRCVYCGSTENLQLDHIIPFSKGGSTAIENLQLLCQKCNLEKSNHIG